MELEVSEEIVEKRLFSWTSTCSLKVTREARRGDGSGLPFRISAFPMDFARRAECDIARRLSLAGDGKWLRSSEGVTGALSIERSVPEGRAAVEFVKDTLCCDIALDLLWP